MGSRHFRLEILIDSCSLRRSGNVILRASIKRKIIKSWVRPQLKFVSDLACKAPIHHGVHSCHTTLSGVLQVPMRSGISLLVLSGGVPSGESISQRAEEDVLQAEKNCHQARPQNI